MRPAGAPPSVAALAWALALVALAGTARAEAPRIALAPASMQLGDEHSARVEVFAPGASLDDLEVTVSVGTLRDLARAGDGHFVARYDPPTGRAPDVALFVARVRGSGEVGAASLPLSGRYHLQVSVEPGAEVAVRLGATTARRAVASASGAVDMTLHVPPGVDRASIEATDRASNRTTTEEPLGLPPTHRVVVLPASDGALASRHEARWILAAAERTGGLASTPPAFVVDGGTSTVQPLGPGVFLIVCRAGGSTLASRIALRVVEPGVVLNAPVAEVQVPASVPSSLTIDALGPVTAGAAVTAVVRVLDEQGEPIGGLAARISGSLGGTDGAVEESAGAVGEYVLRGEAPARAGDARIRAWLEGGGPSAQREFEVRADAPTRLRGPADDLRPGESEIALTAVDRFGNRTVAHASDLHTAGATLVRVGESDGALRVRLIPRAPRVALWLGGDGGRADALELPVVALPPERPFLSMGLSVRHNLHATVFYGTRARVGYALRLGGRFWATAAGEVGFETALSNDTQGRRAEIYAPSATARASLDARFGDFSVGGLVFVGGQLVFARQDLPSGGNEQSTVVVPALGGGVIVRWRTRPGVLSAELGGETGSLDTAAVRGTLGGVYGVLAWGVAL